MNIERISYMQQLETWKDKQVIKIITGIRRCGKSTIMKMFQQHLLDNGIKKNQIQHINLEELENEDLMDYKTLYKHINSKLQKGEKNYIFLDEIQLVPSFQKAIDSLFVKDNVDIYLTGSNAYLLSGEIATLLSGRYIEIEVYPLSFAEYNNYLKSNLQDTYRKYISTSSFPYVAYLNNSTQIFQYLQGIYNTVVVKDIMQRNKIQDVEVLERIVKFLCDNIGNISSLKSITDTLSSTFRKISQHTLENYVDALLKSYIFYKAERYDIKGKELLKTGAKYYVSDIGFRNMLFGIKPKDLGHILENIVYLELRRRKYQVFIGKYEQKEVDFICFKGGEVTYFQVALSTREETTLQRELEPLLSLKDHFPKYILTLDNDPDTIYNGIKQINVLQWLIEE
ncbi:MAG: ATP-binding protein [Bacteroidales bacterium]|nr:ATP-binding protein [Bacteroidales bacterium]